MGAVLDRDEDVPALFINDTVEEYEDDNGEEGLP
jgi:hypothetical protein